VRYPDHEHKEVGPYMAEFIYEITSLYFTEKRSHHNQWKNQKQEANEDQKGIYGEKYLYKQGYITHNQVANVKRI
jgi:hypothetical protein